LDHDHNTVNVKVLYTWYSASS